MSSRSRLDVLTDAAIEILAERGARALTHRAVESHTGLGPGAASNCFGTRRALVAGVLERMLVRERESMAVVPEHIEQAPVTLERIVGLGATVISFAVGAGPSLTPARRALFAEAATDADLSAMLVRTSATWWTFVADLLRAPAPRTPNAAPDGCSPTSTGSSPTNSPDPRRLVGRGWRVSSAERDSWHRRPGGTMGRQPVVALFVLALVAVVVGVDVLFFRHQFWERLMVNVGIVLVFAAFGLRFLRHR
jgi:AcrR family transcriptional regulator